jgi:Flp pilus assembly pilin Flp
MKRLSVCSRNRRGVTNVQWALLAAVISVAVIAAVRSVGTNVRTNLNSTAGNVANPSTLPGRFGS